MVVVMHIIVMMHIDAYYDCYDAYAYEYYCCFHIIVMMLIDAHYCYCYDAYYYQYCCC